MNKDHDALNAHLAVCAFRNALFAGFCGIVVAPGIGWLLWKVVDQESQISALWAWVKAFNGKVP